MGFFVYVMVIIFIIVIICWMVDEKERNEMVYYVMDNDLSPSGKQIYKVYKEQRGKPSRCVFIGTQWECEDYIDKHTRD